MDVLRRGLLHFIKQKGRTSRYNDSADGECRRRIEFRKGKDDERHYFNWQGDIGRRFVCYGALSLWLLGADGRNDGRGEHEAPAQAAIRQAGTCRRRRCILADGQAEQAQRTTNTMIVVNSGFTDEQFGA